MKRSNYLSALPAVTSEQEIVNLTPAQAAMLRNGLDGLSLFDGLSGRSEHGGAALTMNFLLRKRLLKHGGGLTKLGEDSLVAYDKRDAARTINDATAKASAGM